MNKVILMGNIVRDPETRSTQTGKSVTNFSVATNESYVDAQGQRQNKAQFHNIVAWGKSGEAVAQYLGKGRKILLEGKLEYSDYTDKEGIKRYKTEVIMSNFHFVDSKPATQNDPYSQPEPTNNYSQPEPSQAPPRVSQPQQVDTGLPNVDMYGNQALDLDRESEINVDEIPF